MRKIVVVFIGAWFAACNTKVKKDCDYKKVTSDSDSLANKYVVYVRSCDTNETMLRSYWDNGLLQSITYYSHKLKTGTWSIYDENGRISYSGSYRNGKKIDTHFVFSPNGSVFEREIYDTNGVIQQRKEFDSLTLN